LTSGRNRPKRGQPLGGGESRDVAHLERDHDREDEPHARHGQEELNLRGHFEHGPHPVLEPVHAAVQLLDLLEELLVASATLDVEVDLFASTEPPQVAADVQERLAQARRKLGQRLVAS
jgi:hypothetical protein